MMTTQDKAKQDKARDALAQVRQVILGKEKYIWYLAPVFCVEYCLRRY